jgi:hypothetical protein
MLGGEEITTFLVSAKGQRTDYTTPARQVHDVHNARVLARKIRCDPIHSQGPVMGLLHTVSPQKSFIIWKLTDLEADSGALTAEGFLYSPRPNLRKKFSNPDPNIY